MSKEQENKWREEFEELQFKYKNNLDRSHTGYIDGDIHSRWVMYKEGRKKAQEELKDKDDLIIILKMKLDGARERNKKLDGLIKELMGALEASNMEINDWHMDEDSYCNWNNMLIEKAKKLVGEI
jgi:hypothetical protein